MPSAYDTLKKKRADLMKQVMGIDAVLSRYAEIDRAAQRLLAGGTVTEPVMVPEENAPATPEPQKPTPIPEFERRLREILESLERPISRGDLLGELKSRGVVVGGENESNTLGTRLYRIDWVANLKGHGYWHELRDYAPAGYNAEKQLNERTKMVNAARDAREARELTLRSEDANDVFS